MAADRTTKLPEILAKSEENILQAWLKEQLAALSLRKDPLPVSDLRRGSGEFLSLPIQAADAGHDHRGAGAFTGQRQHRPRRGQGHGGSLVPAENAR
ncbi:MAG: RsbRD N-terminal domain-containing protein [Bryobacterales bacterium]|nr:RsbRD N-terminal domain-containing protein [Bryobacterales bacterium]